MYNDSIIVVAVVKKICTESEQSVHTATIQNGRWMSYESHKEKYCVKDSLLIEISQYFKAHTDKKIEVIIGSKSSCDKGEFHPVEFKKVKGKYKKVRHYAVGQQYLFVIKEDTEKNIYYVRAAEKLGVNANYYIKTYMEFNQINKPLKTVK